MQWPLMWYVLWKNSLLYFVHLVNSGKGDQHGTKHVADDLFDDETGLPGKWKSSWPQLNYNLRTVYLLVCVHTLTCSLEKVFIRIGLLVFFLIFTVMRSLKSDSHLPIFFYLLQRWKVLKNDEKYFLFHIKSNFRSQDILIFVLAFRSCRKNGLIRKIRLTLKLITSQPG